MTKYTDAEEEILLSILNAYEDDPSPESGRQYCDGEDEYAAAQGLMKRGLLRKVSSGIFKQTPKLPWIHFGLTDAGWRAVEKL
jgi:hypothetical protein